MNATSCGSRWLSSQSITKLESDDGVLCLPPRGRSGAAPEAAAAAAASRERAGATARTWTSTRTGLRRPARTSWTTSEVWVAEKRPVRRCFGSRARIVLSVASNPMSSMRSASSSTSSSRPRHSSDGRRSMTSSTRPGADDDVAAVLAEVGELRLHVGAAHHQRGAARRPRPRRRGATPPPCTASCASARSRARRPRAACAPRAGAAARRAARGTPASSPTVHACTATSWWRSSRGSSPPHRAAVRKSCAWSAARVGGRCRRARRRRRRRRAVVVLEPLTRRARRRGGLRRFCRSLLLRGYAVAAVRAPAARALRLRRRRVEELVERLVLCCGIVARSSAGETEATAKARHDFDRFSAWFRSTLTSSRFLGGPLVRALRTVAVLAVRHGGRAAG